MRVVHDRYCGLDVHKKSVVACVITPEAQQTKAFGTTTRQLPALADRLRDQARHARGHGKHRGVPEASLQPS